jgi:hypothetical protein
MSKWKYSKHRQASTATIILRGRSQDSVGIGALIVIVMTLDLESSMNADTYFVVTSRLLEWIQHKLGSNDDRKDSSIQG